MNLLRFLQSKTFLQNLLLMFLASIIMLFLTLFFLRIYTQHGASESVPNLIGLTFDEAKYELRRQNFRLAVSDSTYVSDKKPFEIVSQDPMPDASVKGSRKIYLTVNATQAPETKLPDILDSSLKNAREQLASRGLIAGTIEEIEGIGKVVKKMKVNNQERLPGESIFKGTIVDLVVTDGLGQKMIQVPYVIGQTLAEARAQLRLNQLEVGAIVNDEDVRDFTNAFVYQQKPTADNGNVIQIGGAVDLYLQTEEIFDDQIDYLDEKDYEYYDTNTGEYKDLEKVAPKKNTENNTIPNNTNTNSNVPNNSNTDTNTDIDTDKTNNTNPNDDGTSQPQTQPNDLFKRKP